MGMIEYDDILAVEVKDKMICMTCFVAEFYEDVGCSWEIKTHDKREEVRKTCVGFCDNCGLRVW